MDSTLEALKARFPGMEWEWEPDVGGWVGGCGSVAVHVEAETDGSAWAHGWIGNDTSIGATGVDPVAAVEKLTIHKGFAEALHAAPVQPMRAEYIPPTPEQLATAQTPQSTPYPALLLRAAWAALWPDVAALAGLAALLAVAMVMGWIGMWWITGGGQ